MNIVIHTPLSKHWTKASGGCPMLGQGKRVDSRRLPMPLPALPCELAALAGEAVLAGVVETVLDYPLGLLHQLHEAPDIVAVAPGGELLEHGGLVLDQPIGVQTAVGI